MHHKRILKKIYAYDPNVKNWVHFPPSSIKITGISTFLTFLLLFLLSVPLLTDVRAEVKPNPRKGS
jgi:hypothetical protein